MSESFVLPLPRTHDGRSSMSLTSSVVATDACVQLEDDDI